MQRKSVKPSEERAKQKGNATACITDTLFSLSMCHLRRAKQKYGSLDGEESDGEDSSAMGDECEECEESRADDVEEDRMVVNEKSMDAQVPQSNKSQDSK